MPANRFQLSGPSMEAVHKKAEEYGAGAKIIAAEKVRIGGIFGQTVYQAVVEVPSAPAARQDPQAAPVQSVRRHAIGDLLAEANEQEAAIHAAQAPAVSTSSPAFEAVLDSVSARTSVEEAVGLIPALPSGYVPTMSVQAGDMVVLAGVGDSAVRSAELIAASLPNGALIVAAGAGSGGEGRIEGGGEAMKARARGVLARQPVLVAYGLGTCLTAQLHAPGMKTLGADQTWLVVDVSRKPEDTKAWVDAVAPSAGVTALAVVGTQETGSPRSARKLGIPVGWVDTAPGKQRAA